MRIPRHITLLSSAALVAVASSVFLLPQNVSALEPTNSLIQNKVVLEEAQKRLEMKSVKLKSDQEKIEEIKAKRQALADQLEADKAEIEELNKKLEAKKSAAEAARVASVTRVSSTASYSGVSAAVSMGSVAGNGYAPGYCTWYAKNKRPDLPNNLGNANTWYSNAAAMGLPVGTTPRVGAIGQAVGQMHVVYVEAVNGDTVTISEMNYGGLYRMNTRTVPASNFVYIY